ncbi:MAG: hypothetical protein CMJ06_00825 [Pelagibacterales bacterium]|nr:hypothetical protein [Pelagibacterales bacterium]OUU63591.1 MAG: hypothetical protein CBC22_00795 [Alphaproteobacteria bacterium TMED62]|tara:strand:- start:12964 stop:13287 length:324 start_codon:yes stop_codon:yes gene_type:complete
MSVTRQHARHKLPVQVFYNKQHLKLIDFSLGGTGVEIGTIDPPEKDAKIRLILIFPVSEKNVGWEITAKVVRVDSEKNFMAFEFVEDDDFKKFSLAFYDEMRKKGLI